MIEEGMKIIYDDKRMYVWQILNKWVILLNSNKNRPKFIKVDIKEIKRIKNG